MQINNNLPISLPTDQVEQQISISKTQVQAETQTQTVETFNNNVVTNTRAYQPTSLRQSQVNFSSGLQVDKLKSPLHSTTTNALSRKLIDPKSSVSFIKDFNQKLDLSPTDLKGKYALMTDSSFGLFRAMPALFYKDIKGSFAASSKLLNRPAPTVTIDGDMHIQNFGTFRGPDGKAVWGINDFDQSDKGSPEWDLERLAISAVFVARQAGLGSDGEKQLVSTITKKYFDTIKDIAAGREMPKPFLDLDHAKGSIKDLIQKSSDEKRKKFLEKYTSVDSSGNYKFLSNDKLHPVSSDQAKAIKSSLKDYQSQIGANSGVAKPLQVLDVVARSDSGGSSFGLPRYYALVANNDAGKAPVILEIKAVLPPPIKDFNSTSGADAQKVVERQKTLAGYSNPLTGSLEINKRSFLVRELEPEKNSYASDKVKDLADAEDLFEQAAKVLAGSHGRTPDQATAIDNWIGNDQAKANKRLTDFSTKYADQITAVQEKLKNE